MLGGQAAEARGLDGELASVRRATSVLSFQRFVSETLDGYVLRYLGILSAFTAMMPAIYHGVGARANDDPTEYFLTCLHLLVNVGLALRDLVGAFKVAATARGYATRVGSLYSSIEAAPTSAPPLPADFVPSETRETRAGSVVLKLDGLCVSTPTGSPLLRNLDLELRAGQRLLVRGPNGAGKSSLLRVLAGVWEPTDGQIAQAPPHERIAFVPQRAYVPERLSVRAMLAYPRGEDAAPADDKLVAALRWAGLEESVLRGAGAAGLSAPVGKLSGGEMQRLMLARLVLSPPALAVLDEASANLEAAFEAKVFEWAKGSGVTLLTVSHSSALEQWHTHSLTLDGEGGGKLAKM